MRITFDQLKNELTRILLKKNFSATRAEICARIFAENSLDGVLSHGLNRFPDFIKDAEAGRINPVSEPTLIEKNGALETWDGNLGPGMYVANLCTKKAIELARIHGLGLVSVRNTNHWMRGGTYAWQAADEGCIAICSTNTIANVTPWGGTEPRLGNNPLVIGVPRKKGHVVLDMAISQYSFGKLQVYKANNEELPLYGGYDNDGNLTKEPADIIDSKRGLPIGFWKGSGLSMILDVLLTALTGGRSTAAITASGAEYGLSQFFLCINKPSMNEVLIEEIINYTKSSPLADPKQDILYPGENSLKKRKFNQEHGIPVTETTWNQVLNM